MNLSLASTEAPNLPSFSQKLSSCGLPPVRRGAVTTLQLNIGWRCNLACHHCHVESGPNRREKMSTRDVARVIELLERSPAVETLDITGGAPEMHDQFRPLVAAARQLGRRVIDRCNLTIFFEPGQADTPEFLAAHDVDIVASLPCYTRENVDRQRGRGVFGRSIEGLQLLNTLGYGRTDAAAGLDLVYNPQGTCLPPGQPELEARYREELRELFGIEFRRLLTITNMPIKRFAQELHRTGSHAEYMSLLVHHFNAATVPALMCRSLVSVGFDGRLYDCDFNQMLELDMPSGAPITIWDIDDLAQLEGSPITTASHCFGCTAGSGSSCGGALT